METTRTAPAGSLWHDGPYDGHAALPHPIPPVDADDAAEECDHCAEQAPDDWAQGHGERLAPWRVDDAVPLLFSRVVPRCCCFFSPLPSPRRQHPWPSYLPFACVRCAATMPNRPDDDDKNDHNDARVCPLFFQQLRRLFCHLQDQERHRERSSWVGVGRRSCRVGVGWAAPPPVCHRRQEQKASAA